MHDIDRVLFEITGEAYGEGEVFGEEETYETYGEGEVFGEEETYETYGSGETYSEAEVFGEEEIYGEVFGEGEVVGEGAAQEIALASELLEVTTEEELDRFLGNVLRSAVSAASNFARSDAGRAVGGILKTAARKALPQIGQAVGDYIAPGAGGALGQRVGSWLGGQFELGLQTEGLSAEDREYQTARTFTRFAADAARRAAQTPTSVPAGVAAQRAIVAAAQRYLPGLVRPPGGAGASGRGQPPGGAGASGRGQPPGGAGASGRGQPPGGAGASGRGQPPGGAGASGRGRPPGGKRGARRPTGRWVRRGDNIIILGA